MSLETSLLSVDPESSDDNRNERKDKKKPPVLPWLPRPENNVPPVVEAKPLVPGPIFAEFSMPKSEAAEDKNHETEEDDDEEDAENSAERDYDDARETDEDQYDEVPEPPLLLNHDQIGEGTLYAARQPETVESDGAQTVEASAPNTPPEFDELLQQLVPFAETNTADQLQEPPEAAADGEDDAAWPPVTTAASPPPPPNQPFSRPAAAQMGPPPGPHAAFNVPPSPPQPPNWNMGPPGGGFSPNYNTAPTPSVSAAEHASVLRSTEKDAEKRGMRKGLVAGFITGYVLKGYLDKRKRERYEKATAERLQEHRDTIARLHAEQAQVQTQVAEQQPRPQPVRQERPAAVPQLSRMERPAAVVPQAESLPPIKMAAEQVNEPEIFDQEGNKIILQPGQRVERSAGGYSVVLDEHNRVVHDAIHYGEAYKRDQKREQLTFDPFASATAMPATMQAPDDSTAHLPEPRLESGQADFGHELPSGQPREVDVQHRLRGPRNPVVSAVASPWLWTAIAVLLIAYFVAALA